MIWKIFIVVVLVVGAFVVGNERGKYIVWEDGVKTGIAYEFEEPDGRTRYFWKWECAPKSGIQPPLLRSVQ